MKYEQTRNKIRKLYLKNKQNQNDIASKDNEMFQKKFQNNEFVIVRNLYDSGWIEEDSTYVKKDGHSFQSWNFDPRPSYFETLN